MYRPVARASLTVLVFGLVAMSAGVGQASAADRDHHDRGGRHVLLISVDGLHASDLSQWIEAHPSSRLASLSRIGTTFTHASASTPSDSFPGLLAMLTGGTPASTGVFYDDAYSRSMWAPGNTTCSGTPGTETVYAENLDRTLNSTIPLFTSIDPANLPLARINGQCTPVFPHSFLRTNTIFDVAHAAGLYTAWADKHPAYEIVNGPSNRGVNDLFTPEINNANDPTAISVTATTAYDQLKVQAVLNEIDGRTSDGHRHAPVPAIFGMNFQAVSVGEKLVDPVKSCQRNPTSTCDPTYFPGGYEPGTLEFTPQLNEAMAFVDTAIGSMVDALHEHHLQDSTQLILSAKHGQSPIDPAKLHRIGDAVTPLLTAAGVTVAQSTEDDISLIWLVDQHQTLAAVRALVADETGANSARIQSIISGEGLAARFGDPLRNDRTPDIIVQPIPGTIYTGSKAKVAEHGGFAEDDTHVALLVVSGERDSDRAERVQSRPVQTTQIAPTILRFLNLPPQALESVQLEHTRPLSHLGDDRP
jgi:Type I phosphodiesterase / nucleotide pyrophosphatase